jgi:hypothetical protein
MPPWGGDKASPALAIEFEKPGSMAARRDEGAERDQAAFAFFAVDLAAFAGAFALTNAAWSTTVWSA